MEYNIRDIISLEDGNDYEIVSKTEYNDDIYCFLADVNNPENVKFCVEKIIDNALDLTEIEDVDLIKVLIPKLARAIMDSFGVQAETEE